MFFFPSKQEAEALETELLEDYRFGKQQFIEILGHSCAMAVTKVCCVDKTKQMCFHTIFK